jgi:non-ribosomal peptide synthetase component F
MTDKDPILPILPIQYKDYAVWQRQFLQADNLKQKMAYAKQQLSGAPAYSGLPPDHSRLPVQTFNGKIFQHVYSATLNNALHLLCKKESTTLFTVLLMAFQLLLSRYTGQNDIVVGVPNANRHSTMMENLIGCFITTLVVRNQFFAALTINEMLQRTHEALLESYQYQDLPFEKLLEGLAIKRSSAIHPLFQVMFVLQNADQMTESLTVSNLKLSVLELNNDVAKFDLTLSISESEQGLVGKFEYNSDLYNEHTIILLAQHYGELLEGIVANPQRRVSELSFASTPLINSVSLCPQSREYIEGEL